MPRFFTSFLTDNQGVLEGENAKHATKSLRLKIGEDITLCDGEGTDYYGVVKTIEPDRVTVKIHKTAPNQTEPSLWVHLYQALPKGDKMDFIVQKSVELGASEITPVLTQFCVSRPDMKSMKKKVERWQKIALEAAKQSGRGRVPKINDLVTYEQYLKQAKESTGSNFLCYENGGQAFGELCNPQDKEIGLLVGSEGGFSQEEVESAKKIGVQIATLGPRILRCETAPITALSVMMYLSGNLQ